MTHNFMILPHFSCPPIVQQSKNDVSSNNKSTSSQTAHMTEKRWLVAYVKMHHEKRVSERLTAQGIENFLPIQEELRQWSDRRKKIKRVLIPMMIFVRVTPSEQRTVLALPSVLHYLTLRGDHAPSPIADKEMDRFRFMIDRSGSAVTFISEPLLQGQKVRVCSGTLEGLEGELMLVDNQSRIVLRIEQLGCAMVEMSPDMVEKIG